jgi:hypothetical protein
MSAYTWIVAESFVTANLFGAGTLTVTQGAASVVVGSPLPGSTYGQLVGFTVTVSGGPMGRSSSSSTALTPAHP